MINQKLHLRAMGVAFGSVEALWIFGYTLVLIFQPNFGESVLTKFIPFYTVSWSGAFLGLIAGFIDGFIGGILLASVYNFIAKQGNVQKHEASQ